MRLGVAEKDTEWHTYLLKNFPLKRTVVHTGLLCVGIAN